MKWLASLELTSTTTALASVPASSLRAMLRNAGVTLPLKTTALPPGPLSSLNNETNVGGPP